MYNLKRLLATSVPRLAAVAALAVAMGGTWQVAIADPVSALVSPPTAGASQGATRAKPSRKALEGKLNLNTATVDQLMALPAVGPAKAERIVTWRKKQGGFKRIADLRRVKGFGYKTFKRLEPFLDVAGENTLASK